MFIDNIDASNIFNLFFDYNYIVIFATGKNFLYFEKRFEDTIISTKKIFVIDNDQSKFGTDITVWGRSYIIYNLDVLRKYVKRDVDKLAIIVTCNAYKEIVYQLENDETLKKLDAYFFKDIDPALLYLPATRKYNLLNKWLCLKNVGKSICDSVLIKKSKKIAFYGFGDFGKRFVEDLYSRDKKISFCVVEKKQTYFADFEVYAIDEELPTCDLFVITEIEKYNTLQKSLRFSSETRVYAIDSILEDLWNLHWNLI